MRGALYSILYLFGFCSFIFIIYLYSEDIISILLMFIGCAVVIAFFGLWHHIMDNLNEKYDRKQEELFKNGRKLLEKLGYKEIKPANPAENWLQSYPDGKYFNYVSYYGKHETGSLHELGNFSVINNKIVKDGIWIQRDPDVGIIMAGRYKNDIKHGFWKIMIDYDDDFYNDDLCKHKNNQYIIGNYKNGKKHGWWLINSQTVVLFKRGVKKKEKERKFTDKKIKELEAAAYSIEYYRIKIRGQTHN